ncbi:hypothetical protein PG988_015209 [Apiospora saccharicola]
MVMANSSPPPINCGVVVLAWQPEANGDAQRDVRGERSEHNDDDHQSLMTTGLSQANAMAMVLIEVASGRFRPTRSLNRITSSLGDSQRNKSVMGSEQPPTPWKLKNSHDRGSRFSFIVSSLDSVVSKPAHDHFQNRSPVLNSSQDAIFVDSEAQAQLDEGDYGACPGQLFAHHTTPHQ